jgi:hypothetical protein
MVHLLDAKILVGEHLHNKEVNFAFSSDLMSDVLAFVADHANDCVLLTGLTNNQVIRTAEMLDLSAIVFVRGKCPPLEVVELARENNMVLIATPMTLYTTSGILFGNGLAGIPL